MVILPFVRRLQANSLSYIHFYSHFSDHNHKQHKFGSLHQMADKLKYFLYCALDIAASVAHRAEYTQENTKKMIRLYGL